MNADALAEFFASSPADVVDRVWRAVRAELKVSDRCGLGYYAGKMVPSVIGPREIDAWAALDGVRVGSGAAHTFVGVLNRSSTRADVEALLYGV